MAITVKDVEHVAKLARLELTEEEKEKFTKQLGDVLKHVDAMNEVDTKAVKGRIVSREDYFLLAISGGRYSPLNRFQRDVLKTAITFCEETKNKGVYSEVKVGATLYGEGIEIECDSLTDEQLGKLKESFGISKK